MKWFCFEAEDGEFYEFALDDKVAENLIPIVNNLHRISIWDSSVGISHTAFIRKGK